MSLNAARPTLQRSLSSRSGSTFEQHHRLFSIAVPARLARQTSSNARSQTQTPCGFLAEKGPFKFQQRAISYEEVVSRSRSNETETEHMNMAAALKELAMLRKRAEEQRKTIGVLQGTISDLLSAERKSGASS
ncbi:hypothetical protein BDV10DRAFT_166059 [Aspergillus recurvatus]